MMRGFRGIVPVLAALGLAACGAPSRGAQPPGEQEDLAKATFAGGCFWCMQPPFEHLPGVVSTTVGYTGGTTPDPTYEQVSAGGTGHAESIEITYDPAVISYERLLDVFWHNVDPLTKDAQFCDHGPQYRTAIFYHDEEQRRLAEESRRRLEASQRFDRPIVTEIVPAGTFYPAEEYHQHYHEKNPLRYRLYRWNCGRDQRLEALWGSKAGGADVAKPEAGAADAAKEEAGAAAQGSGFDPARFQKPSDAALRRSLTPLAYQVTQRGATEPPFQNLYWHNEEDGIYVDVVSGEPLFSSRDKFDSGTGWPSFTRPLEVENVRERTDYKLLFPRTEIRSAHADSHLGHVFDDGPPPTGKRYCMNSAALRFVPVDRLEAEGYGRYRPLFARERTEP